MNTTAKKVLAALGLMAAGGLLTMVEMARELTVGKHAQENRDATRILLDGFENGTLNVEGAGFGKVKVSCWRLQPSTEEEPSE